MQPERICVIHAAGQGRAVSFTPPLPLSSPAPLVWAQNADQGPLSPRTGGFEASGFQASAVSGLCPCKPMTLQ